MTTLTIPKARLFDDILAGDRITAIDGREIDGPGLRVTEQHAVFGIVALEAPDDSDVVWNLYPDTQVETEVTVEREVDLLESRGMAPTGPVIGTVEPPRVDESPRPVQPVKAAPETPCGHNPDRAFVVGPEVTNCTVCGHFWNTADGTPGMADAWGRHKTAAPRPIREHYPAPYDNDRRFVVEYGPKVRSLFRRKPHFVAYLRACAVRPNGVWATPAAEFYARSVGSTLGSIESNYGWCRQLDRGIWQITPAGETVLAAWDNETPPGGPMTEQERQERTG